MFSSKVEVDSMFCLFCVFFEKNFFSGVVKMNDSHYKQRVVIQFLFKSGEKPSEILRKLQVVYGNECMSKTRVFEWAKRLKKGRESAEDDAREGASVISRTDDANIDRLRSLICTSDRRLSIRALSDKLNINNETVRKMLHEDLNMRKTCGKMVSKILTNEQKQKRNMTPRPVNKVSSEWKSVGGSQQKR